ncbi:HNH endonuclease [Arthrobacter sp. JSM 101049]|uniref:HNH endonuclease n=1 Tax=Arthrobacter sp. JSM 101049 TaxID=929097 RepID=UPI001EBF20DE|nr:HNH endonuclease [Micrococcaceae bacterium RIT 802]
MDTEKNVAPSGLTATEAAVRLGLDPKTLRQKLRDGVLLGHQIHGNRWNVQESDLAAYARSVGNGGRQSPVIPSPVFSPVTDNPTEVVGTRAWLLLAVSGGRAFGSNDGYDDKPTTHYRWDDTVGNHGHINVGDAVVLWDKKASIGASVIESIETQHGNKRVYSCPNCGKASFKERKTKQPRYRCFKCGKDFDQPVSKRKDVLEYTAQYQTSWVGLEGLLDGATLRASCIHPRAQLSIRNLNWQKFHDAVSAASGPELMTVLEASKRTIAGGHRTANVRVRVGQGSFRHDLLASRGNICAFTGPTPAQALEAAHLYSFATVGEHHEHGGLLMRRDLHRLFDLGLIAINPANQTISVSKTLAGYPHYGEMEGKPLHVELRGRQLSWLTEHWEEHRTGKS